MRLAVSVTAEQWIALVSVGVPALGALGFQLYRFCYLPLRIPRAEIQRLADEIARDHPDDPDLAAFREEETAWYRGETVEQGKWRRVRRALRRRESG